MQVRHFGFLALILASSVVGLVLRAQTPPPPKPVDVPKAVADDDAPPVALDRWGDPLPRGAADRLGSLRFRLGAAPDSLEVTKDGRFLVAQVGGDVRLLDLATGRIARKIPIDPEHYEALKKFAPHIAHDPVDHRLVISPDGSKLYGVLSSNFAVRLVRWDLKTFEREDPFQQHPISPQLYRFSNDGKRLLVVDSLSSQLRIVDAEDGKELLELYHTGHAPGRGRNLGRLFSRILNAFVAYYLPGIGKGLLNQADSDSSELVPHSIFFTHDDKHVVVVSKNAESNQGQCHVWDAATGKVIKTFPVQAHHAVGHFSAQRNLITVTNWSWDETPDLLVYDLDTGKELWRLELENDVPLGVQFSPDGAFLVTSWNYGVRVLDAATGKERASWKEADDALFHLAFSPDGKTLYASNNVGFIRRFSTATWKETVDPTSGHRSAMAEMRCSRDGKSLVSADQGRTILTWNTAQLDQEPSRLTIPRIVVGQGSILDPFSMVLSANGRVAAAFDTEINPVLVEDHPSSFLRVWDIPARKELCRFAVDDWINLGGFQLSPMGNFAVTVKGNGTGKIWNARTGKEVCSINASAKKPEEVPDSPDDMIPGMAKWLVAFSPDERLVAVVGAEFRLSPVSAIPSIDPFTDVDRYIRIYEMNSGKERKKIQAPSFPAKVHERIWGLGNGPMAVDPNSPIGDASLEHLTFTADGKQLVVCAANQAIFLDLATGKEVRRIGGCTTSTITFSPDGRWIAASGDNPSRIRVWDAQTGIVRAEHDAEQGPIYRLAFSPDGKTLFTSGQDGTILVWKIETLLDLARPSRRQLDAAALDAAWEALAGDDAAAADAAIWKLVSVPKQAVPMLDRRLGSVAIVEAATLDKLLADLDANDPDTRNRAADELEKLERQAESALRKALERPNQSLEFRRRVERLLEKFEGMVESKELIQSLRAIEILERIGTPEARKVLERLAKGPASAIRTVQAKDALERLDLQPRFSP